MSVVALVALFVILGLLLIWKIRNKRVTSEPPLLPGWYPIIGHGYKLMGDSVDLLKSFIAIVDKTNEMGGVAIGYIATTKCYHMLKSVLKVAEQTKEMGGVTTAHFGPRKLYIITDPDDIVTVTNSCQKKHMFYDFAKPILGNGLVTADVSTWKKNRKLLNPAFNQQVLDGFIETFNTQAEKLVEQFAKEVGKPFDQDVLLRVNNLETICLTSLGAYGKESEYNELFSEYLSLVVELMNIINTRLQKFWLHSDFIYSFSNEKKQQDNNIKHLTALSNLIIKKKRLDRKSTPNSTKKYEKFKPFLDLILDLSEQYDCLSDQQIQWETDTIIGAGHETIGTTLTFTLAVLGSYPDVQEKAYKEIRQVLAENKAITKEQLSQLVYIDAIVKEAQRLYAITTLLARQLDQDIQLKKYTLKAGTGCVSFIHSLHRHSMWGADADQFRPERWLDKETLPDPKYYGAFGLGRRNCIGKTYAIMNMKIIMAHLIRKYHISSDINKVVMKMEILIRPHKGHEITLRCRK